MKVATPLAAAFVLVAGFGGATPAAAQDSLFTLRNDSGRTLFCGVARVGRSARERFVLRAGEERSWHATRAHRLACDPPMRQVRYRLEPGGAYRLVWLERSRQVVLAGR